MIGSGDFRHVITIQEKVKSVDAYGGEIYSWADFATNVRAKFLPIKGREFIAGSAAQSEITARFYIRYLAGIKSSMRIVFNGDYYGLVAPPVDMQGHGRFMELLAKSGVNEG